MIKTCGFIWWISRFKGMSTVTIMPPIELQRSKIFLGHDCQVCMIEDCLVSIKQAVVDFKRSLRWEASYPSIVCFVVDEICSHYLCAARVLCKYTSADSPPAAAICLISIKFKFQRHLFAGQGVVSEYAVFYL
jgi:hypothetical protein